MDLWPFLCLKSDLMLLPLLLCLSVLSVRTSSHPQDSVSLL